MGAQPSSATANRILIVEDERIVARDLAGTLGQLGYSVVATVASGEEAVRLTAELRPDLVLMDLHLTGPLDGIAAAEAIRQASATPVIYLTAYSDDASLRRAIATDAFGYIVKPFKLTELHCTIEVALRKHESDQRVRQSEARLRDLIEHAAEAIFIADLDGRFTEVNSAACAMLGYTRAELLGLGIVDLLPPQDVPRMQQVRRALLAPEHTDVGEWSFRRADGAYLPVEASAKILASGQWQVFGRDISERKRTDRLRSEWDAVIAHDLRQPITTIGLQAQTLVEMLRDHAVARGSLQRIVNATQRLDRMVSDLLDLSRLEARQLPLSRQPIDLVALVQSSVEAIAPQAQGRALHVRTRGEMARVSVDADRIAQVLDNLLTNAIKYSAPGSAIELDVEREGATMAVAVSNEGAGIASDELHHLFHRFYRLDQARAGEVKGIGLGLYISRELVEAHGGTITAHSTAGGTTTFRFTLPACA